MDGYAECPSYIYIVTTDPRIYVEQANIFMAYALGIASGLLAAFIGTWRTTRTRT